MILYSFPLIYSIFTQTFSNYIGDVTVFSCTNIICLLSIYTAALLINVHFQDLLRKNNIQMDMETSYFKQVIKYIYHIH